MGLKVLNLYSGVGGNRKHWQGQVTAVELDEKIASVYSEIYPQDTVICGDAHQYLLDHYTEFDFIWSSPPCQSHSAMDRANPRNAPRYPEMELYQEIIFLDAYFAGKWVVENVVPYYKPLVPAMRLGRHLFWSNFHIGKADIPTPPNFIKTGTIDGVRELKDWLGLDFKETIYYKGNHDPCQVLRNCVHPLLGKHVFDCATDSGLFNDPPPI